MRCDGRQDRRASGHGQCVRDAVRRRRANLGVGGGHFTLRLYKVSLGKIHTNEVQKDLGGKGRG